MNNTINSNGLGLGGISIHWPAEQQNELAQRSFLLQLEALGLSKYVKITREADAGRDSVRYQFFSDQFNEWMRDGDIIPLCEQLALEAPCSSNDLEREILLAMLVGPVEFEFPSHDELVSAIRVRKNIVEAARKTTLAFHTTEAERPADYWTYDEDRGFTILPDKSLITALQKATQPDASNKLYSFSCYRATEYVVLLGIAQELEDSNPELLQRLQQQWETRAIKSGEFHEVFLREYGSMNEPLPPKYYVPGDRLWFRNPDELSSNVIGYEGSWVFYLGGGLFTNFWKRDQPYTLTTKCLEIFHWRNATYRDHDGELQIDEAIVEERVRDSMKDSAGVDLILQEMLRLRESKGLYGNGGCIDTSREYPRWVCIGTSDMLLPAH